MGHTCFIGFSMESAQNVEVSNHSDRESDFYVLRPAKVRSHDEGTSEQSTHRLME